MVALNTRVYSGDPPGTLEAGNATHVVGYVMTMEQSD